MQVGYITIFPFAYYYIYAECTITDGCLENFIEVKGVGVCADKLALFKSESISKDPFRHIIIDNFLSEEEFSDIDMHTNSLIHSDLGKFGLEKGYNARIYGVNSDNMGPLSRIVNAEIIKKIASIFDMAVSNCVDAALHLHPVGSKSGWVHTDFNAGWFSAASEACDGLHFSQRVPCDYRSGCAADGDPKCVELTRSIAIIMYFNHNWQEGDGGETGFYRSGIDNVNNARRSIEPRANRLLAFECSPISYHSFVKTNVERKSFIMWAHSASEQVGRRWPLSMRSGWK